MRRMFWSGSRPSRFGRRVRFATTPSVSRPSSPRYSNRGSRRVSTSYASTGGCFATSAPTSSLLTPRASRKSTTFAISRTPNDAFAAPPRFAFSYSNHSPALLCTCSAFTRGTPMDSRYSYTPICAFSEVRR